MITCRPRPSTRQPSLIETAALEVIGVLSIHINQVDSMWNRYM